MRIVLTGSSGRVGRAVFSALAGRHDVIGIDRSQFSTTHRVGDFVDSSLLHSAFKNADAVIHTAALHAPHVGLLPDEEFRRINVEGTRLVAETAIGAGVKRLVFTSTTALYGYAVSPGDTGSLFYAPVDSGSRSPLGARIDRVHSGSWSRTGRLGRASFFQRAVAHRYGENYPKEYSNQPMRVEKYEKG